MGLPPCLRPVAPQYAGREDRRKVMLRVSRSRRPVSTMLSFLFRGLTAEGASGARLFEKLTAETRRPSWYLEGQVPDTLDGRFAVLATLTALTLVRLESEGEE